MWWWYTWTIFKDNFLYIFIFQVHIVIFTLVLFIILLSWYCFSVLAVGTITFLININFPLPGFDPRSLGHSIRIDDLVHAATVTPFKDDFNSYFFVNSFTPWVTNHPASLGGSRSILRPRTALLFIGKIRPRSIGTETSWVTWPVGDLWSKLQKSTFLLFVMLMKRIVAVDFKFRFISCNFTVLISKTDRNNSLST